MKRQKASNIYFAVTLFTVQCTCSEKNIHFFFFFTFEIKIDHQLILSLPIAMKTKMALLASGSLKYLICAEDKRMAVLKKTANLVPKKGTVETVTS